MAYKNAGINWKISFLCSTKQQQPLTQKHFTHLHKAAIQMTTHYTYIGNTIQKEFKGPAFANYMTST